MTDEKSPEQQRRQTSSMASSPVGRASSDRRPVQAEEARSKAASSYALPCPPDSRRRVSRDALSKSLGDYRYMAVPATGRASCVALGHYPQVAREAGLTPGRAFGPPEVGSYYVPEHPYAPGYVAYPAMGSYELKQGRRPQAEPTAAGPQDNQNTAHHAVVTQVGMMHQAGDVAGPTTALAAGKQQGSPVSPGEKSAESDWSPTKELMKEDARSAIYYAGTASEGSSEQRDKRDESSGSSISTASSSGSSDTSAEPEPQKIPPPTEQVPLSQHLMHMQQLQKMQDMQEMQQMQQMQQMHHQLQQMRQHMQQQQYQQQMQQLQQSMSDQDDPQKPAPQQAPRLKDPRAESAGRAAASVAPAGPPRGYFFRPARENGSHTKQTESRSQFSVVSLAAPLLPASAASLANRSAMEQACILVNVVLLSVLTGIVAAFLVRQLT